MSNNVEDLYLKGFMAFSSKNYSSAKAYWEQVIKIDANHEKAKKGLTDLQNQGKSKKRSSKEVFQEIKRLHGEKKYAEALRLCELLLKKHPNNTDLQGLRTKLMARAQQGGAPEAAPASKQEVPASKSTIFIADAAAASLVQQPPPETAAASSEDVSIQVEKFIQKGVGLYEIQDFQSAIDTWKKALELDPDNRIARDYIENVQSLLEPNQASDVPAPTAAPEAAAPAGGEGKRVEEKPSKERLIQIYNEAMDLFKQAQYQEAMEKWNFILTFHPNHKETLQCIERTRDMMPESHKQNDELAKAQALLAEGKTAEADRIATRLVINAPDLEGLDELQDAIMEQQQNERVESVSSLEVDDSGGGIIKPTPAVPEALESHSASDAELTSFFTEDKKTTQKARRVAKVVKATKEKKPVNKFLVVGLPLILLILGVGGYFGRDFYKKQLKAENEETRLSIPRDVHWNSAEQHAVDLETFAGEFLDLGDSLMAFIAYQRVTEICNPRLDELDKSSDGATSLEVREEIRRLNEILLKAREKLTVIGEIEPLETSDKDLDRAQIEMNKGQYADAIDRLYALLSRDIESIRLRDLLGEANRKLAFQHLNDANLDDAFQSFKRATVLQSGNDLISHHTEVINRYYQGKITDEDKNQWFFFFEN